ncbi:MAG: class I SAM-dependent DNA methyltransferase, partial [Candidatus Hodarchaeota archaeon]
MSRDKSLGQYFTPPSVTRLMVNMISHNKNCSVLEPSAGKGAFLKALKDAGFQNITAIELDGTLENISDVDRLTMDFFDFPIETKFDVIVGNPPYVRWKNLSIEQREVWQQRPFWGKRMNGLTDILQPFIFKAVDHLKPEGELIFITPIFWMQTLYAVPLRKFLLDNGILEAVFNFYEHSIFSGINVNLIIFKYRKTQKKDLIRVINIKGKKKIAEETVQLCSTIYHQLLGSTDRRTVINENQIKGFLKQQPQNCDPWRFIPDSIETELLLFEEACKYSPVYPIAGKETKISELFTKRDLQNIKGKESFWTSVNWQGRKYWRKKNQKLLDEFFLKTPAETMHRYVRLGDLVEIGNGLVSGLDKAFRVPGGLDLNSKEEKFCIDVIKARNLCRYYSKGSEKYFLIKPGQISSEKELKQKYSNL